MLGRECVDAVAKCSGESKWFSPSPPIRRSLISQHNGSYRSTPARYTQTKSQIIKNSWPSVHKMPVQTTKNSLNKALYNKWQNNAYKTNASVTSVKRGYKTRHLLCCCQHRGNSHIHAPLALHGITIWPQIPMHHSAANTHTSVYSWAPSHQTNSSLRKCPSGTTYKYHFSNNPGNCRSLPYGTPRAGSASMLTT